MAKNRVVLRSNFPAVKSAAHGAVRHARDLALEAGQETANKKIELMDRRRDYNISTDVSKEDIGFQSGKIVWDHWWARFFEYGTTYIPASPVMRPAHRQMRKVFVGLMGTEFDGWIKRKAGMRR